MYYEIMVNGKKCAIPLIELPAGNGSTSGDGSYEEGRQAGLAEAADKVNTAKAEAATAKAEATAAKAAQATAEAAEAAAKKAQATAEQERDAAIEAHEDCATTISGLNSQITTLNETISQLESEGHEGCLYDGQTAAYWHGQWDSVNTEHQNCTVDGKTAAQWKQEYDSFAAEHQNCTVDGKTAAQWKQECSEVQTERNQALAAAAKCTNSHVVKFDVTGTGGEFLTFDCSFEPDVVCITGYHNSLDVLPLDTPAVVSAVWARDSTCGNCYGLGQVIKKITSTDGETENKIYVAGYTTAKTTVRYMRNEETGKVTIQNIETTSTGNGKFYSGFTYFVVAVRNAENDTTCLHETVTEEAVSADDGTLRHTITKVCADCGAVISTRTEACADADGDGLCDACGSEVGSDGGSTERIVTFLITGTWFYYDGVTRIVDGDTERVTHGSGYNTSVRGSKDDLWTCRVTMGDDDITDESLVPTTYGYDIVIPCVTGDVDILLQNGVTEIL